VSELIWATLSYRRRLFKDFIFIRALILNRSCFYGKTIILIVVMGPGQNFLSRAGSSFCGSGRVSHLWFGFWLGKFSLKMSNFTIFFPSGKKKSLQVGSKSIWVKAGSSSYLLWVKSNLGSGWVGSGRVMAHLYLEDSTHSLRRNPYFNHKMKNQSVG